MSRKFTKCLPPCILSPSVSLLNMEIFLSVSLSLMGKSACFSLVLPALFGSFSFNFSAVNKPVLYLK